MIVKFTHKPKNAMIKITEQRRLQRWHGGGTTQFAHCCQVWCHKFLPKWKKYILFIVASCAAGNNPRFASTSGGALAVWKSVWQSFRCPTTLGYNSMNVKNKYSNKWKWILEKINSSFIENFDSIYRKCRYLSKISILFIEYFKNIGILSKQAMLVFDKSCYRRKSVAKLMSEFIYGLYCLYL